MIRTVIVTCSLLMLTQGLAAAQTTRSRFYAGGVTAVDGGTRGNISGGAVPSAGGLFGVRISEAWSVEAELEHGFHSTERFDPETLWFATGTSSLTREEIERRGIWATALRSQKGGPGVSAHAMWRTREPGRINVGFIMGVSSRFYSSRVVRTPTRVGPDVDLPPSDPLRSVSDETRRMAATGLTGGVVVLGRLTPTLTVAPEIRYTHGMITNDSYRVLRAGVRLMWNFQ
jgi:hypothetical protein